MLDKLYNQQVMNFYLVQKHQPDMNNLIGKAHDLNGTPRGKQCKAEKRLTFRNLYNLLNKVIKK
jgi:hypothetical protein